MKFYIMALGLGIMCGLAAPAAATSVTEASISAVLNITNPSLGSEISVTAMPAPFTSIDEDETGDVSSASSVEATANSSGGSLSASTELAAGLPSAGSISSQVNAVFDLLISNSGTSTVTVMFELTYDIVLNATADTAAGERALSFGALTVSSFDEGDILDFSQLMFAGDAPVDLMNQQQLFSLDVAGGQSALLTVDGFVASAAEATAIVTPPVPLPASLPLLVAGFGLMSVVGARRRSRV